MGPALSRCPHCNKTPSLGICNFVEAVSACGEAERITGIHKQTIEELYRRHAPEARRLAYLLTGSMEAADDITQDAFIRVIGRLGHLRDANAFGPYLRRTVVNAARMQFRRRKVEARYVEARSTAERADYSGPDSTELEALRAALMQLPYRQRAAIALRFYLDLDDAEIGDWLGCATGTVRSLVSRGLASVRGRAGGELRG